MERRPVLARPRARVMRVYRSKAVLFLAFAFAVMADPVSSVAYAIEAALRALDGNLSLLALTMGLVVAIVALVVVNYQQLVARYPGGGGASAAVGEAFGDAWSFIPIGALIVDFVLTIAISVSAGASAIIAYFPDLAPYRVILAVGLVLIVAGLTWFGHFGRLLFAIMTLAFIVIAGLVLVLSIPLAPLEAAQPVGSGSSAPALAVIFAFPVAMALATGVEAPASAIGQLGQLDDRGRIRFGQLALWLTLGIVGSITIGLAVQAERLGVGVPAAESTLIADLARYAAPAPLFAAFQLVTALLLLAAASSSFQAGPGLLRALARPRDPQATAIGVLPSFFGTINSHFTPYWGVVFFAAIAALITTLAGGYDQILVLFYAVAVFLSFLAGLAAMGAFSIRERRWGSAGLNIVAAVVVAFTLVVNLSRGWPVVSLIGALVIAVALYVLWVRAGRPRGVRSIESHASDHHD